MNLIPPFHCPPRRRMRVELEFEISCQLSNLVTWTQEPASDLASGVETRVARLTTYPVAWAKRTMDRVLDNVLVMSIADPGSKPQSDPRGPRLVPTGRNWSTGRLNQGRSYVVLLSSRIKLHNAYDIGGPSLDDRIWKQARSGGQWPAVHEKEVYSNALSHNIKGYYAAIT
ncbi:hypothetical protein BJX99DRAFT_84856 [Aspergillus californicus]